MQNGQTNRVPSAVEIFSTMTAQPGLQNRKGTCSGGCATARTTGFNTLAGGAATTLLRPEIFPAEIFAGAIFRGAGPCAELLCAELRLALLRIELARLELARLELARLELVRAALLRALRRLAGRTDLLALICRPFLETRRARLSGVCPSADGILLSLAL